MHITLYGFVLYNHCSCILCLILNKVNFYKNFKARHIHVPAFSLQLELPKADLIPSIIIFNYKSNTHYRRKYFFIVR